MAAITQGMNPQMLLLLQDFQRAYPGVNITSGYRDPAHNARVGGAKGSQHIHGNAMDFSMKGLTDAQKLDAINWWKNQGASGFGYYPGSDSAHVDIRQGPQRYWGPDYTKGSLNQTPEWFQTFAGGAPGGSPVPAMARGDIGGAAGAGNFSLEALQASQGAPSAGGAPSPIDDRRRASAAALGASGMQMMQQGMGGQAMALPAAAQGPGPGENRPQPTPLPKRRVLPTPGPKYEPLPVNRFVGGLLDG
jgi:hypothetical protein